MKETNGGKDHKVVPLARVRQSRRTQTSVLSLLCDTRAVIDAIKKKTCLICHTRKPCVSKTGLCSACYEALGPQEKITADREAAHKIITVSVSDDRGSTGTD